MKLFCVNSQYTEENYIGFADCTEKLLKDYADFLELDYELIRDCGTVTVRELPTPEQVLDFFRCTADLDRNGIELFTEEDFKEIALYCAHTDEQYEAIDKLF